MIFLYVPKFYYVSNELQQRLLAALIWTKPFRVMRWAAAIRD
jgi:hypothetical protein